MICNQRKDINLGTDYTVTGVHEMQGEAFAPVHTLVVRGRSCRLVQEFSGGNAMLNNDRTGKK